MSEEIKLWQDFPADQIGDGYRLIQLLKDGEIVCQMPATVPDLAATVKRLESEKAALVAALKMGESFLGHDRVCSSQTKSGVNPARCDCGFSTANKMFRAALSKAKP